MLLGHILSTCVSYMNGKPTLDTKTLVCKKISQDKKKELFMKALLKKTPAILYERRQLFYAPTCKVH